MAVKKMPACLFFHSFWVVFLTLCKTVQIRSFPLENSSEYKEKNKRKNQTHFLELVVGDVLFIVEEW